MDSNFEEAFYEVSEILKILPKEITDKIPEKFIQVIEQNKSKTYTKEINGLDNLQDLKKETIAILGLIYRDFLCDKETRKELLIEEQKELDEAFNYNNMFKKYDSAEVASTIKKETTALIEVKEETWYTKVINFFKHLFKGH